MDDRMVNKFHQICKDENTKLLVEIDRLKTEHFQQLKDILNGLKLAKVDGAEENIFDDLKLAKVDHAKEEEITCGLYDSRTGVIWVLDIEGMVGDDVMAINQTGFAVDREGYILSCAHGGWSGWSSLTIKARPLIGRGGFKHTCDLVYQMLQCDMSLFKVDHELTDVVEWGTGDVSCLDTVMLIGHPPNNVGSGSVGHVAFPCTDVNFNLLLDRSTCRNYISNALVKTPKYRIMGHIYNKHVFREAQRNNRERNKYEFESNLLAKIPLVQCSGLVGGTGSSGGPIFNSKGHVVAMMIAGVHGYDYGIHVSVLRVFAEWGISYSRASGSKKKQEKEEITEIVRWHWNFHC